MMNFLDHNFMKKVVTFIILSNVVFTLIVLVIFCVVGEEPIAIIAAWFTFTTGQLGLTTILKNAQRSIDAKMKRIKKESKA